MTPHLHSLITALCLAALAAGCGGGSDAPTASAPARTTLTLDFDYVEVIEDCDGIEGDGDFHFSVVSTPGYETSDIVYLETLSLGPGGRSRTIGRRSYTLDASDGTEVHVSFKAAEVDRSIFGAVDYDQRLDDVSAYVRHVISNGAWSNLGPQSITLGSAGCLVRLRWSAEGS